MLRYGLVLALMTAGTAQAQARDAEADLRCMIGATAAAERVTDAALKQQLMGAAAFYMGRIDGRLTDAQIEAKMREMAPTMQSVDWQREMAACGEYLRQRGNSFRALGARLAEGTHSKKP